MLHDHDRTGKLWSGVCDGCLAPIFPLHAGAREVVECELVAAGWKLDGAKLWCVTCARSRRETKQHNRRGRRTR